MEKIEGSFIPLLVYGCWDEILVCFAIALELIFDDKQ